MAVLVFIPQVVLILGVDMRLNQYIASCGVCSRRDADKLIESGQITVNGNTAHLGDKVEENDTVIYNGNVLKKEEETVVLAYYKPVGVVCTERDSHAERTVIDEIDYDGRVTYAGRLDKDSEGLLLLTNNGRLIEAMMRGKNLHEKEYEVVVDRDIDEQFIGKMSQGVFLEELGAKTRPCKVQRIGNRSFDIILTQGLNRQIRRMCKTLGRDVVRLKRVRVMTVELKKLDLKAGEYVVLGKEDTDRLMSAAGLLNLSS